MDSRKLRTYSARVSYQDPLSATTYEFDRYSGAIGRYRYGREQRAVKDVVSRLDPDATILDCPTGVGRWWDVLAMRAHRIIGVDISEAMLAQARLRANLMPLGIELLRGEAERIPLANESVDYSFSHALTKHLPIPLQYEVLTELARVARSGVICSFGIFSHLTYEFWRRRRRVGGNLKEDYAFWPENLEWMAADSGLAVEYMRKCSTPMGIAYSVLLRKLR